MKLHTSHSISERLAIPLRSIQKLTRDGEIPCIRYGPRTIRYKLKEVRAALEKRGEKVMIPTY